MKKVMKFHPFAIMFVLFNAWILLEYKVGTIVGILGIIICFLGIYFFKGKREEYFSLTMITVILFTQLYALYARLNLLPGEVHSSGYGGFGAAIILMLIIVAAPFLSIIPTLLLARVNKKFLLLILPATIIASYWYFYLYSVVGYF